jgi:hypothetical protein
MVAVLALGTQNGDADITRSCLALRKWNPVSADALRWPRKIIGAQHFGEIGGQ